MSLPIASIRNITFPRYSGTIQIVVRCPYCLKDHRHGAGTSLENISRYFSERLSDCDEDPRPYTIGEDYKEEPKSYNAEYHRAYHRKYYHEVLKNKAKLIMPFNQKAFEKENDEKRESE